MNGIPLAATAVFVHMVVAAWSLINSAVIECGTTSVLMPHLQNTIPSSGTIHRHHWLVKTRHKLAKERLVVPLRRSASTIWYRLKLRHRCCRSHRIPTQTVGALDCFMGRIRLLEIGAVVPETIAAIRVNGLQRTLINLPQQSAVRCAWERFRHLRRLGYISGECGGGIERTHSLPRGHLIPLAPICSSNNGVGGGGHIMLGRVVKVHLGLPPIRSYCIGADVAASNLCISVGHPGGFAACQVRHITVEATIGNVPCNCSGYVGHPCCH